MRIEYYNVELGSFSTMEWRHDGSIRYRQALMVTMFSTRRMKRILE